jgi:hypothetical protein
MRRGDGAYVELNDMDGEKSHAAGRSGRRACVTYVQSARACVMPNVKIAKSRVWHCIYSNCG